MITKFDESVAREMCRVLGIDFDDPATSVCGISMTGKRLRIEIEDHSTHPWVTRVHKLYYNWSPEKPPHTVLVNFDADPDALARRVTQVITNAKKRGVLPPDSATHV